jgi:superfamily II DNA or RNA helicase
MTKLEIGNIYSKLTDATIRALTAVDSALAVTTPNYRFSHAYKSGKWDGKTRFFKIASKKFPTGLVSEVIKALKDSNEPYEWVDKRTPFEVTVPESIDLLDEKHGSITLRDYQYNSVKQGLQSTRGVINVATNGGKTEIACGMMSCMLPKLPKGKSILFFTHSKEIFYQSAKRISERLGMEVGLVGDGVWDEKPITVVMIPTVGQYLSIPKTLPKNAKRTKMENEIKKIGKSDPDRVKQLRDEITILEKAEWDKIKLSVKKTKNLFSSAIAFIADEVHHASSTTWYDVFMKLESCYYRFGLTGTVDRSEENAINNKRLFGCTGKIVTKISNSFLIENGYSAKPTIYMIEVDCPLIHGGDYRDSYDEGIVYNDKRNAIFADKVQERSSLGNQCLIIVNEISHGEEVARLLLEMDVESVFTHGQKSSSFRQESLDQFKAGQIKVLIATPILDEGVDISGISCLFLMAGGKSMRQLLQRIGRGLRKKADGGGVEVYDALDYHNEYLAEHTLERYETYKAEGFHIVRC